MTATTKKRRIYWVADQVTPRLKERALLLEPKGYDVQFFTSLETFASEVAARRAGIVVVSDEGNEKVVERILLMIMAMPEIQGARMVMVSSGPSERLAMLAACASFRDIIPADLEERLWLTRFIFATGGRPLPYVQPTGQITLHNISALTVPARITWVTDTALRFESRVRPPVGSSLSLSGPLAELIGVPSITLTVTKTQHSHLLHRFSDAAIAAWSVPALSREQAHMALAKLAEDSPGPRCRVFIAVQSPDLRARALTRFDDPRFEMSAALQKQSLVEEPRYFTPHLVVIEDVLCTGEDGERLDRMLANLAPGAAVAVLGHLASFKELQAKHPGRRIVQLSRGPEMVTKQLLRTLLPSIDRPQNEDAPEGACHVLAESPVSLAKLSFPARLVRVHPLAAKVALPFPVGTFALARLESPLLRKMLGRNPWLKITTTYQDTHPDAPPFVHLADGYLADVSPAERRVLATSLGSLVSESLLRINPSQTFGESGSAVGETRTPELGSLRIAEAAPETAVDGSLVANLVAAQMAATTAAAHERLPQIRPSRGLPAATQTVAPASWSGPAAPRLREPAALRASVPESQEKLIAAEHLAELAEASAALRKEVVRSVRTRVTSPGFRQTLFAIAVVSFVSALLWAAFTWVAPHVSRSGGVYTDQLEKFAAPGDISQP